MVVRLARLPAFKHRVKLGADVGLLLVSSLDAFRRLAALVGEAVFRTQRRRGSSETLTVDPVAGLVISVRIVKHLDVAVDLL